MTAQEWDAEHRRQQRARARGRRPGRGWKLLGAVLGIYAARRAYQWFTR